jgi:hypothetical protein
MGRALSTPRLTKGKMKPSLNDLVIASRGITRPNDFLPDIPVVEKEPPSDPTWIPIKCLLDSIEDLADEWPRFVRELPRIGDLFMSREGKRKSVLTVIHTIDSESRPLIQVELGTKKYTDVTATGGGGSADSGGFM